MSSLLGHQMPPTVQQNEIQVTPPNPPLPYVTDQRALESLCHTLRQSPRLALDTEFVGEDTFIPRLELIQVATAATAAVIDFPAVQASGSLDVFWELICDAKIEKIVHAGRQDLDLFAIHAGQIPKPFFDTQIAAAMVGYGAQVAYANLVQRLHGKKLAKAHTFTNWSARPLSDDQIAYALEDVEFLLSIHTHLQDRLSTLGRLEWVSEEFARLETAVGEKSREPQERYQRIRGWDTLKPKGKRKPAAGTCLAGVSCEMRCSSNSHAIHPNRSMSSVVSAASIPPRSIDKEYNYWPPSPRHWRFHRLHGRRSLASENRILSRPASLNSCKLC
jgi:hypothetical protein